MVRIASRLFGLTAALGFIVAAVWLLWADRGTILGDRIVDGAIELARWMERVTAIDLIDRSDIPARTDQVGHAVLWSVGTVLIGSLRMLRRPLAVVGLELAALSLVSEIAQPLVSTFRGFEPGDALANLVGVAVGVIALAMLSSARRLAYARR